MRRLWPSRRRVRDRGRPASANGASSFHLWWDPQPPGLAEASAVLTVLEPPSVPRLYFWALQASYTGPGGARHGGGHLGLQWHPGHPGSTAVNFGGYDARGVELRGSSSALPSATRNPNTRDYSWAAGTPYRLRVMSAPGDGWLGEVTDLSTGVATEVRSLEAGGDRLSGLVVWSEVFARCDDPTVVVRWSDVAGLDHRGRPWRPAAVRVTYQAWADGGCTNTDVEADGAGAVLQRTAATRRTPPGARLPL